jgi:putative copper resistance protein D
MADPLIFVRGVHFAATLAACGTIVFIRLVAEPAKIPADFQPLRSRLSVLILLALVLAILSGAVWLVLIAADILGAPLIDVCLHGGAWPVLFETRFGLVWCTRFALALVLVLSLLRPIPEAFQLATAALLLCLPATVGHAGATPGLTGDIHLASDMLHLLTAGAWLGSLPAFVLLLWQAQRNANPAWAAFATRATRRFSTVAILSVNVLLGSGLINSWNLLGGPRDLFTTDYGRLIALKAGLFTVMLVIAAVNRFYLTPRLPERGAMRSLQRNSLAEITLGLCVLGFVGALGTLSPTAHTHPAPEDRSPDTAFVHIHAAEAIAEVTITPGRAGSVQAAIRVMREDFTVFPAKEVRLRLEPPAPSHQALEREAADLGGGLWQVSGITIPEPGIWTVKVTITPQPGETILLDAPVVIER